MPISIHSIVPIKIKNQGITQNEIVLRTTLVTLLEL